MIKFPEAPLHRLICRRCNQPFNERTNYPQQYTLCFRCDTDSSRAVAIRNSVLEEAIQAIKPKAGDSKEERIILGTAMAKLHDLKS